MLTILYMVMGGRNYYNNEDYPLSKIEDPDLHLSLPPSLLLLLQAPKIAIWKDVRLDYLDIPKGHVELLQTKGFTIEMILEYGPSKIAEKLGIDDYVAQIIFNETSNATISFNTNTQRI
jgi:hypothetical protein